MKFDNVQPVTEEARAIELPLGKSVVTFMVTHCDVRSPTYLRIKGKLTKPVSKLIEAGMLPKERDRRIAVEALVMHSVVGWSGVTSGGAAVPFTKEACIELLVQAPDVFYMLAEEATDIERFRVSEEQAGN